MCFNLTAALWADVYLAGTVMLIFGMGLYGLFISNDFPDVPASDRALKGSSLFGMFALKVSAIKFRRNFKIKLTDSRSRNLHSPSLHFFFPDNF